MRDDVAIQLKREFGKSAAFRREQELFAKQVERRLNDRREDDRFDSDLAELTAMVVMASEADITAFRVTLDSYDAATVEALMENERMRDIAQAKIDELLDDAFVLPDGRRVFKSRDGRVFDEHGVELGPDEIDPDLIEDWRPEREAYLLAIEDKQEFDKERAELLGFQERVDQARVEIEADDLTKQDLDTIKDELAASIPVAAKKNLLDHEEPVIADVRGDFAAAAPAPNVIVPDLTRDLQRLAR